MRRTAQRLAHRESPDISHITSSLFSYRQSQAGPSFFLCLVRPVIPTNSSPWSFLLLQKPFLNDPPRLYLPPTYWAILKKFTFSVTILSKVFFFF